MKTTPTREEQIAMSGINYTRRHDISYRAGLVLQVLGAAVLAVLFALDDPFFSLGILLFEAGVLLSAVYLLVWMHWVKKFIAGSVLAGIALQTAGFFAPEHFAGQVILAGLGLVCAGAAGMAGKEAYCFGWREGWALMWAFPIVVLVNLLGAASHPVNTVLFALLAVLLLMLAARKLRQPLLVPCSSMNACGQKDKRTKTGT